MLTSPIPRDISLYQQTKKYINQKYPKPSAYRSGLLVQEYKKRFLIKHNKNNAYIGRKTKKIGLNRWFSEKWTNQNGKTGYHSKSDVYRPTYRITKKTPITYSELSKRQIEKARRTKYRKGRIPKFYNV